MANEFKIRKGLIIEGASGGTVVDIQGSLGQLFSVTDNLTGSIFTVSDISGVPILDVNSSGLSTFSGDITLGDDLNFSTNGFADISNTGTGAMRFKPSSQTLALTLTGANATFAGDVTVGTGIIKASIGSDIAITQGAIGLRINDAASAISPTTATSNNDNVVDLGVSNIRFRNLYMGGSITSGGAATFAGDITTGGDITIDNTSGDPFLKLQTTAQSYVLRIDQSDSEKFQIRNTTTSSTALSIDTSDNATFAGDVKALRFEMNPDFAASNEYLVLSKMQGNDGGIILKSKPTSGSAQNDWQIINHGTTGDLKFYAYGLGAHSLILDRETGNATFAGDITFGDSHFIGDDASDNLLIQSSAGENIIIDSLDETLFRINGSTKMQIKSSGNVGIGVTAPSSLLHLESASSPTLRIKDTTQGATLLAFSQDSNSHIGTYSNHPLVFDTNSAERMRIDSAGNVGIGTTIPQAKLDIDSTMPQLLLQNSAGTNSQLLFEDNSGSTQSASITFDQAGQNALYITTNYDSPTDSNKIFLQPGGETAMTLIGGNNSTGNAGNVGIGTVTPNESLHVHKDATPRIILTDGTTGTTSGSDGMFVGIAGDQGFNIWNYENTYTRFAVNNSEAMRITSAGNVGIGTDAPGAKLQVKTATNQNIAFNLISGGTLNGIQRITSYNDAITASVPLGISALELYFLNGASSTESMRITSAGNVGVSQTDPQSLLHVGNGSGVILSAGSNTWVDNTVLSNGWTSGVGDWLKIEVPSGDDESGFIQLNSNGNVGIGVIPLDKFHVNGGALLGSVYTQPAGSSWTTSNAQLILGGAHNGEFNSGTKVKLLISGYDNDDSTTIYPIYAEDENGTVDFWIKNRQGTSAALPTMYFAGNVGIGDSSPSYKLDVNGTGRFVGVLNANTYVNTPAVYGTTVSVGGAAGGSPRLNFSATGITTQGTGDISLLSGNVGIGNGNPQNKLDIEQSAAVSARILATGATSSSLKLEVKGGATQLTTTEILANSSGALTFATGTTSSTERMRITSAGNLGVGTVSPIGKMEISTSNVRADANGGADELVLQNNGYCGMSIFSNNANAGQILFGDNDANISGLIQYWHSDNSMRLGTSNTERMRIDSAGRVGIGTDAPAGKLHIMSASAGAPAPASGSDELIIEGSGHSGMTVFSGTSHEGALTFGDSGGNYRGGMVYSHLTDSMTFRTAGVNNWMKIDSSGNVGINTTAPLAKLDVRGTLRSDQGQDSGPGGTTGVGEIGTLIGDAGPDDTVLGTPNKWLKINLDGNDYLIPAYSE